MANDNIKNLIGKYMGKVLDKEGEKDGKQWQKFKLQFLVDDKKLNFNVFMPYTKKDGSDKAGVSPKNLEEGKWYRIGYTEYNGTLTSGETYVSKTVIGLFDDNEPTEKQLVPNFQPKSNTEPNIELLTGDELALVANNYKDKVDPKAKSLNHFIGTMIMSKNPTLFDEMKEVYTNKVE